jgi:prepilin-type N-terminal cleavage/methylation domain-containing protein
MKGSIRDPAGDRESLMARGFTLIEVVVSMGILALLAASVYAIVRSAISASQTVMDQQLQLRRVDAFLRVTRDAFLNLPAEGTVAYEVGKAAGGQAEQRLILGKARGLFGIPSLGGGSLVLAARPRSDGTRTITMLRIPPNAAPLELEQALAAPGVPLLPGVIKPRWSFFANNSWNEEWPDGSPRPELVRLQFEMQELPNPVEAIFYVPNVTAPPAAPSESAAPTPTPTPAP